MVRDRLVRTASGSSTSQPPIDTTIDELMEGTADLIKLSNSENALPVIMKILARLLKSDKENGLLRRRLEKLEVKNECNERKLEDLEDRLFKDEQYSSRATVILTGVEVTPDEDVSSKVCSVLNKAGPQMKFNSRDFTHCHQNRPKPASRRPPTITVVFSRSCEKDLIMAKEYRGKLKSLGINAHHHMGPTVIAEFRKLSDRPDVQCVQYLGHAGNFGVKMEDDSYVTKVLNCKDLDRKISKFSAS